MTPMSKAFSFIMNIVKHPTEYLVPTELGNSQLEKLTPDQRENVRKMLSLSLLPSWAPRKGLPNRQEELEISKVTSKPK